MPRSGALGTLVLALALPSACVDQTLPTSLAQDDLRPSYSSQQGFERAGFVPFESFGTGCQAEFVSAEVIDGVLFVTMLNHNIEVSREERISGPSTVLATAAIDAESGELQGLSGTVQYAPTAVNGTWELTIDEARILNGKLHRGILSGVGTGELDGLGISAEVNVHARASVAPPHLLCAAEGGPFLTTGQIFEIE